MKKIIFLLSFTILLTMNSCKKEANCNDGILNQNETKIDCGGTCEACPSCFDGVLNGDEEDIDCGGSCLNCEEEETNTYNPYNPYNLSANWETSGQNHELIGESYIFTTTSDCGIPGGCFETSASFINIIGDKVTNLSLDFLVHPSGNTSFINEGDISFLTQEAIEMPGAVNISLEYYGIDGTIIPEEDEFNSKNVDNTNNTFIITDRTSIGSGFFIIEGTFDANLKNSEGDEFIITNCEFRGAVEL